MHWKTLAVDKLQLAPLETEIKSVVREKWLLKLSFGALRRYNQIRKGKKVMYQSIVQYYNEMLIEKSFKKLVTYTDHRLVQRDMKEEADLFYKKQSFQKLLLTAQKLSDTGTDEADYVYNQRLQVKVIEAFRRNITRKQEKLANMQKATVFEDVWLKTKVLRAFAMHNLMIEQAK